MQREIERNPIIPKIDTELINLLTKLCFQEDELVKSDLIFVFGTNIIHEKLAHKIHFLLSNNYSSNVLITGGIANYSETNYLNTPESRIILSYIDTNRYNDVKFYIEEKSKNNLENVQNAIEILDYSKFDSIICLSHSYASGRSVQTLRNNFKNKIVSFPYDVPSEKQNIDIRKENWWLSEIGKSLVWGEYLRIEKYGMRGDFNLTRNMIDLIIKIEELTK